MNKWIWLLVRVSFSLILLGVLFWKTDLSKFSELFRTIDLPLFFVSLISYTILFIPLAYRWQLLLQALDIRVPMERLIKTYLVGVFFNNFLPTAIGGDVVRGLHLYRFTQKGKEAVVSVIVERFLGFTAMIVIGVAALVLSYPSLNDPLLAGLILGTFLVYLAILIVMITPTIYVWADRFLKKLKIRKLGSKLLQIQEMISVYKSLPFVLIQLVFLSLFLQSLAILIYYILCLSLHLDIPLIDVFLFLPIISLVSMIPISLGGLGIREGISIYLFQKIGIVSAHAMGLSIAWYFIILFTSALGGIIYAFGNADPLPSSVPPG